MTMRGSPWLDDRRGVAAVEFALIAPLLLLMLGGVADFGLMMSGKSQLANGVAQGAQYAMLIGPSVSATTVQTLVKNGTAGAGVTATVTATVTGPTCYCTAGSPVALTSAPNAFSTTTHSCTGTCPATAQTAGAYLKITASYSYKPLMPLYSKLSNTTVSETVTVRLQ